MWVGLGAVERSRGIGYVALGSRSCFKGYFITGMFSKIRLDTITTTTTEEHYYILRSNSKEEFRRNPRSHS